jgi:hypothetical protein
VTTADRLTDQQLDEYAVLADTAAHIGEDVNPRVVTELVDEVRRLQRQRSFLLGQIAKKDAASGEADKALRELLAADTPDATEAPADREDAERGRFTATVSIIITAPTAENADAWADTIADLVQAEHGDQMRLDISVNPPTLPRDGQWKVTRGGETLYTAATRAEAEAVGTFAIRQETNDPTVQIAWICPACYGDDQYCRDCSEDTQWYLHAAGVITEVPYAVERTTP